MMVRFGLQPFFSSSPKPRAVSISATFPLDRIVGAVDPRIVMVAMDDPFVGVLLSRRCGR